MTQSLVARVLGWFRGNGGGSAETGPEAPYNPLASLPPDLRLYAIGDVHGCSSLLDSMLWEIDRRNATLPPRRTVEVLLGDIVDRGPDSRRVIETILRRSNERTVVVLRGNHEQLMLDALDDPRHLHVWLRLGGLETLRSYGVVPALPLTDQNAADTIRRARAAIPRSHVEFLAGLPALFRAEELVFVHAGLRPGSPVDDQEPRDLMQIREPFLSHVGSFGSYVVHGHTPARSAEIRHNRLNLDTGAYATGRLSGAMIDRDGIEIIEAIAPGASA